MDKDEGKEEPQELEKEEEMRLRKKTSKNSSDKCSQEVRAMAKPFGWMC